MVLFFFMQKTAYEMRISDWSFRRVLFRSIEIGAKPRDICIVDAVPIAFAKMEGFALRVLQRRVEDQALEDAVAIAAVSVLVGQDQRVTAQILDAQRSEEHTSELQSLMRISYAVFCLNKKKRTHKYNHKM